VALHVYSKWVDVGVGKPIKRHWRGHSPKDTASYPRTPKSRIYVRHHEMLYKIFWVFTRRRFLVRNQRFGTTCLSHPQGLELNEERMSGGEKRAYIGIGSSGWFQWTSQSKRRGLNHIMQSLYRIIF
jgi:hypothetical protein